MATQTVNREFWTPREVAEKFRVSTSSVMRWIHAGQIGARQLSCKRYVIPDAEVERIKNTPYIPEAQMSAQEVKRRQEEAIMMEKAALARLRAIRDNIKKGKRGNK